MGPNTHSHAPRCCGHPYHSLPVMPRMPPKVKSLRRLDFVNHTRVPYTSTTSCTHGGNCKKCMKMSNLTNRLTEHWCNKVANKCYGYDDLSMVASTSQLFFRHLFRKDVYTPPSPEFARAVEDIYKGCESARDNRWNLAETLKHLQQIATYHKAADCLKDAVHIKVVVQQAYAAMTTGFGERCKKDYC